MSTAKTAKLLNDLLASQKADRARIKQLEGRLADATTQQDSRQAAAVSTAVAPLLTRQATLHARIKQLEERLAEADTRQEAATVTANWQILGLKQQLYGARQLLAAADAANEELRTSIEALGANLDKASADLAAERVALDQQREELARLTAQTTLDLAARTAEIATQREELTGILNTVREHMRRREVAEEQAILNRKVIASGAPGVNFR